MNDLGWKVLEYAIAGAVTSAVMGWLLRRRSAAAARGFGAQILRYPPAMRLAAWGLLVVPLVGIAGVVLWQPPKPGEWIYYVWMVIGFGLLGGTLVLDAHGVAHELRSDGLERVTPWRGRRFLPWSQVEVLRFSESSQNWRIVTASGDGTWISVYVSGLGSFARAALERVRSDVIDREPATRMKLVELAGAVEPSNPGTE
jgi:hypothetical protein